MSCRARLGRGGVITAVVAHEVHGVNKMGNAFIPLALSTAYASGSLLASENVSGGNDKKTQEIWEFWVERWESLSDSFESV